MIKITIPEDHIVAVASKIEEFSSEIADMDMSTFFRPTAIKVIDSILASGLNYKTGVGPKLQSFEESHPNVKQVTELADLMSRYSKPVEFLHIELGNSFERKANALNSLVKYLCGIIAESPTVSEEDVLKQWADEAEPQDCYKLDITGIGVATFQWLRMLLGADTSKPDTHIMKFISEILDEKFSDVRCVFIMEAASAHLGLSTRKVDHRLWQRRSKYFD